MRRSSNCCGADAPTIGQEVLRHASWQARKGHLLRVLSDFLQQFRSGQITLFLVMHDVL